MADRAPLPDGALGIGWRPEICGVIAELDGLGFAEVIAESLPVRRRLLGRSEVAIPAELTALIDRGVAVVPHGISLSLGGAEPVDEHRIEHLARCAEALGAPLVSEHVAFVRAGGIEAGHLLPVPRSKASLDVLARNISRTQSALDVPLAVENIAALFDWPDDEYTESEFLAELVDRTGVYLLIDIANVYANARNRTRDPLDELRRLPPDRVAYCHVAGGHESGGHYHDTHTDPIPAEVLTLVTEFTARHPVPLMLERDGNYPPAPELLAELDVIAAAAHRPPITDRAHLART
ncbi:DUF692 domain-containing protein [Nocardia sp. CA-128927]|uniref:DUF692 domain-containing protein n=1 Tax=Nocardia sp. CA-128927 TaxID=3239975 RepID=UPI003D965A9F